MNAACWSASDFLINNSMRQPIKTHRVSRDTQRHEEVVGFRDFEFASPFEGGLGGSAPLLVRFLGANEKMNKMNLKFLIQFF